VLHAGPQIDIQYDLSAASHLVCSLQPFYHLIIISARTCYCHRFGNDHSWAELFSQGRGAKSSSCHETIKKKEKIMPSDSLWTNLRHECLLEGIRTLHVFFFS